MLDSIASPTTTMTKSVTNPSVAASCGSRVLKRIRSSSEASTPVTITRPCTSRALARIDPTSEVCATTSSPAPNAKSTTKSSGRFPSVACRYPVTAGPKRSPTCSVATATTQASAANASVAAAKAATADAFE